LDGRVFKPGHDQSAHRVRMEWGPTGATAVAADVTAVVDVLSFTTTVCIAVERGIAVLPYVWKDERAKEYAAARDAVLAVGRFEARSLARDEPRGISLSPAEMATAELTGVERIVLPSPNGSTICFALAETGATVAAASLRNASAVAAYLAPLLRDGASCAVDAGRTGLSPEARVAEHACRAVRADLAAELAACAGGAELAAAGYVDDVEVAGQLDVSRVVPVLRGGGFPGGQD
jgi:2-phosphosulfolactate phosphatase